MRKAWFVKNTSHTWSAFQFFRQEGAWNMISEVRNEKKRKFLERGRSWFIDDFNVSCRLCVRRFDEDKPVGADEEFAESKFDDESLSRAESAFKSARVLVRAFRQRRGLQKTTSAVKRRRGGVCRWHELTRHNVTWRDTTSGCRDASRWDGHPSWIPRVAPHACALRFQQLPCQDNQSGNRWVLV